MGQQLHALVGPRAVLLEERVGLSPAAPRHPAHEVHPGGGLHLGEPLQPAVAAVAEHHVARAPSPPVLGGELALGTAPRLQARLQPQAVEHVEVDRGQRLDLARPAGPLLVGGLHPAKVLAQRHAGGQLDDGPVDGAQPPSLPAAHLLVVVRGVEDLQHRLLAELHEGRVRQLGARLRPGPRRHPRLIARRLGQRAPAARQLPEEIGQAARQAARPLLQDHHQHVRKAQVAPPAEVLGAAPVARQELHAAQPLAHAANELQGALCSGQTKGRLIKPQDSCPP